MSTESPTRLAAMASTVGVLPAVAGQRAIEPSTVASVSPLVRVAGSFVLVLLFGGVLVSLAEEEVDHAVDISMASPLKSTAYGVVAQVVVVFFGFYAVSQLARIGGQAVDIATVTVGVLLLSLAGFGFTVVGTWLTDLAGERRPWYGAVVGAAVSGAVWLIPSFAVAAIVWVLVAAVGIGGPTGEWLHAAEDVDIDPDADA